MTKPKKPKTIVIAGIYTTTDRWLKASKADEKRNKKKGKK